MATGRELWTVAGICLINVFCWLCVDSTPSFFRIAGSETRIYCLSQPFESRVREGFNSKQEDPKLGVKLAIEYQCGRPVLPEFHSVRNPETASRVNGTIAVLPLPNCAFRSFVDFFEDLEIRVALAAKLGATGAVVVLGNVGQPPPLHLFSTVIPVCIADAENGAILFDNFDSNESVRLVVDPDGLPLLAGDQQPKSDAIAQLRVTGIPLLGPPLPVWAATFNNLESLVEPARGIESRMVLADWNGNCKVTFEGTGEFSSCQHCWNKSNEALENVFSNSNDFKDNVVLFYTSDDEDENSLKCFPEPYQRSLLAERLGAIGVLLAMRSNLRSGKFPGPKHIPAAVTTQSFGLLHSHAGALAAVWSQPGVSVKFPDYDPDIGFPTFLAPGGEGIPATRVEFQVPKENGEMTTRYCPAGLAAFNPMDSDAVEAGIAVIARPVGPCLLTNGNGCILSTQTKEKARGNVLILFIEDFLFFYSWSQFVSLATGANASKLILINLDDSIFTLIDTITVAPMPVFNLENSCGHQLVAAAQRRVFLDTHEVIAVNSDKLDVTLNIPEVRNGIPVSTAVEVTGRSTSTPTLVPEPLSLISEEVLMIQVRLVLVPMRYFKGKQARQEGTLEAVLAGFSPLAFSGTTEEVALAEVVAECLDSNTDGGLTCDLCEEGMVHLKPASPSTTFRQRIALIRPDPALCLKPQVAMNELGLAGARATVFASYFRNLPAIPGEPKSLIPGILMPPDDAQLVIDSVEQGVPVQLEIPAIKGGQAAVCTTPECDLTDVPFAENKSETGDTIGLSQEATNSGDNATVSIGAVVTIVIVAVCMVAIIVGVVVVYAIYRRQTRHMMYAEFSNRGMQMSHVQNCAESDNINKRRDEKRGASDV